MRYLWPGKPCLKEMASVRHCDDFLSLAFGGIYNSLGDTPLRMSMTATYGGVTKNEGPKHM